MPRTLNRSGNVHGRAASEANSRDHRGVWIVPGWGGTANCRSSNLKHPMIDGSPPRTLAGVKPQGAEGGSQDALGAHPSQMWRKSESVIEFV